ncbi:FAD-dependent thymidylate synthase [Paralimibaculum aggregatum]|uniref:Flavin-dependent thymidylate synthase n=1 Tax=Paralimibaculum aggregatum TaxID=3036245 RepID=A0ABQ6LQK3_9RHOB|nr:FAD-dependent thymidylate synthase [Limibaculum sp. NKW23]GMG83408.1 FAD-dependent thymidylate synthase [Limibaculum sp. NKW23]
MPLTEEQQGEIAEARGHSAATLRPVVPALEARLHAPIPVLDHGLVRVVDYMGDDAAVVQAARVSYGAGTRTVRDDAGLIRYLMRHWHSTPFEMCEIKLHVKLPLFVARQWIRHRTASVNEISARYSVLDREFYIPAPEALAAQSATNRQGRGAVLEGDDAALVLALLKDGAARAYGDYEAMLDEEGPGLARELARMALPANIYTQWYWKTNLHNLMHFLRLRGDAHAQWEIRAYAEAIGEVVRDWVPLTWAAFEDYRLNAAQISGPGMAVLCRMLAGETVEREGSGLSAGEWRELMALIGRGG